MRRRPLLLGVLVIAVVGGGGTFALGARPGVELLNSVPVENSYVGTTYAFDGVVCVGSQVTTTVVTGVEVTQSDGSTTRVVRAPDGPPTVGFPVDPAAGLPVDGFEIPAGEPDCGLRILVTPDRLGAVAAGEVRLSVKYGPGGLLRRTLTATPAVTLDATGTGEDPRTGA